MGDTVILGLGVAILVANFSGATGGDYNTAIQQQLDYLLTKAPRNTDGAISHRSEQIQLWSDNVSMVPPFLAYYGALHNNATVMAEAYNQVSICAAEPILLPFSELIGYCKNRCAPIETALSSTAIPVCGDTSNSGPTSTLATGLQAMAGPRLV